MTYISLAVTFVCTTILSAVSLMASALASLIAMASIAIADLIQTIGIGIAYILTAMTPISVVIFTIIGSILLMLFTVQMVLINLNRIVAVLYAVLNGPANIVTGCFDLILTLIIRFITLLLSSMIALFSWIISELWNLIIHFGISVISTNHCGTWAGMDY